MYINYCALNITHLTRVQEINALTNYICKLVDRWIDIKIDLDR